MVRRVTGVYERTTITGEAVNAFVPYPLPPSDPPLRLDKALTSKLAAAEHALERLELALSLVPSVDWFVYGFVRKEAVLSSQVEGTQATLIDLLTFESDDHSATNADVEEICNYLDALRYARKQLAMPSGLPLSTRLLNETHKRLMRGVRGAQKSPGATRTSQNWIGGTRPGNAVFVPPPPQRLPDLLKGFESYLHADKHTLAPLVRIGLLHVQFETIHPYLDGNGRIGRLLDALLLEHWKLITSPVLYLSLHFKRHRAEYYRLLNAVRVDGSWESWIAFFLEGVHTIADEAVASARALHLLIAGDRAAVMRQKTSSVAALRLFEQLPRHPIVTVASAMELLASSKPTTGRAIDTLVAAGVLTEMTGKRRDRSYAYRRYLDQLRVGTDLEA